MRDTFDIKKVAILVPMCDSLASDACTPHRQRHNSTQSSKQVHRGCHLSGSTSQTVTDVEIISEYQQAHTTNQRPVVK